MQYLAELSDPKLEMSTAFKGKQKTNQEVVTRTGFPASGDV